MRSFKTDGNHETNLSVPVRIKRYNKYVIETRLVQKVKGVRRESDGHYREKDLKQFEPTPLLPPVINTFLPDTQNRLDMISKAKCQTVYHLHTLHICVVQNTMSRELI